MSRLSKAQSQACETAGSAESAILRMARAERKTMKMEEEKMSEVKMISPVVKNVPWQEKPEGPVSYTHLRAHET